MQLSDGNAHAVRAEIAEAEDALSVRDDDGLDVALVVLVLLQLFDD